MDHEQSIVPISIFTFEGENLPVTFVETTQVVPKQVFCDVYGIDEKRDLGIIRIEPGGKTPRQKVLEGTRTVEGWRSGRGKLIIEKADGSREVHEVGKENQEPFARDVEIGEIMRWVADPDSELEVYEVCYPPYVPGRYENLPDSL